MTFGIVTILLLAALWIYLLLFGAPQNARDIFSDLGFAGTTEDIDRPEAPATGREVDRLSIASEGLSQLSTRPVAGFVLIEKADSQYIRYGEKGTGHIYEIDLASGQEYRLSGKTVANTSEVKFNEDGTAVALTAYKAGMRHTQVYMVPEAEDEEAASRSLPVNSGNIALTGSSTVFYTIKDTGGAVAYEYDIKSGAAVELWRLPLSDINVFLTNSGTYVVNKPAPALRGALYLVVNGKLEPVSEPRVAYAGKPNKEGTRYLETYYDSESGQLVSYVIDVVTKDKFPLRITALPEKCAFASMSNDLWCGAMIPSEAKTSPQFLRNWYSGVAVSDDMLWKNNLDEGYALLAVDVMESLGFSIDITDADFSTDGSILLFRNKLNDNLWLYFVPADLL